MEKHKIAEFVGNVAGGLEEKADIRDRLKASDMLKEWAIGKSISTIEMTDTDGKKVSFVGVVVLPSDDRGLAGAVK
jgi:hypothetical protein